MPQRLRSHLRAMGQLFAWAVFLGAAAAVLAAVWRSVRRKRELLASRLAPEDRAAMLAATPLIQRLGEDELQRLEGLTALLLETVRFTPAGGFRLERRHAAAISAQAALLLLRRDEDGFHGLTEIVVYPAAYSGPFTAHEGGGVISEGGMGRLGEAWGSRQVVVSWQDAREGGEDASDGRNLVMHEFAHLLDHLHGVSDAIPDLPPQEIGESWRGSLAEGYHQLVDQLEIGRRVSIDPYAATNPQEYFAVATETWFERPDLLEAHHLGTARALEAFYGPSPARG